MDQATTATRGRHANSLNLVRLVLATAVLVSHARITAGLEEPVIRGDSVGAWAVACFFVVSGYLIAESRYRLPLGTYLLHRFARIMPAYWVCLVVTGLLAITCFAGTMPLGELVSGALRYAGSNAFLVQQQGGIAGTPSGIAYPGEWNASLWTLAHEMACYLVLGAVAVLTPRHRARLVFLAVWLGSVLALVALPHVIAEPPLLLSQFARLAPYFFGGVVVQFVLPMERMTASLSAAAATGFVGLELLDPRWGSQLGAPLLAVALLGLSRVLPSPAVIRRHDISYGVYIYAFPFSQALAVAGLEEPWPVYLALVLLLTGAAATASWLLLERRVLRWARSRPARRARMPEPSV